MITLSLCAPEKGSVSVAPAAVTPGSARTRRSASSANARRACSSAYRERGSETEAVATRSDEKPGSTCSTRAKLASSSPAPSSSTNVTATWATTSVRRSVRAPPFPRRPAALHAQDTARVRAQRGRERHQAHRRADRERERERVERRGRAHADLVAVGQARQVEGGDAAQRRDAQQQPGTGGDRREQQVLDEQLARELPLRRAERHARRHLLAAGPRPDERQVGDVQAPDQQHEAGAAPEQVQHRLDVPHEVIGQALDLGAEPGVDQRLLVLREALEVRGVQRVDLGCAPARAWRPA